MKVDSAAVVSAYHASSSSFLDECSLELLMPSGDGFTDAALALPPEAVLSLVTMEDDQPVIRAHTEFGGAVLRRRAA